MDKTNYLKLVKKYKPKEKILKNSIQAFFFGGMMGVIAELLIEIYKNVFNTSQGTAASLMIVTLIFIGCLFTCFGFFDKLVSIGKCGLIIPITGFAHAVMSATLEYRKEGMITGIGANMFKLAGSVIVFGVVSAYSFGLLRLLLFS